MKLRKMVALAGLLAALSLSAYADGDMGNGTRGCRQGALISDRYCPPPGGFAASGGNEEDAGNGGGIFDSILDYLGEIF